MNFKKNVGLRSLALLVLSMLVCFGGAKRMLVSEEHWIPLFNGENLEHWVPVFSGEKVGINYRHTFRVEDGLLRVSYQNWNEWNGKFGHLFFDRVFSHYRLRVEYRFVGELVPKAPSWAFRNNGLMIHAQAPFSMVSDQKFPVSIEVQLLGGVEGAGERSNMNVCTPGTIVDLAGTALETHCFQSGSETCYGDEWMQAEVEVRGDKIIRHFLNGKEVLSYEHPRLDPNDEYAKRLIPESKDLSLRGGRIAIQAEGHPTDFRKIELLILE